MVLGFAVAASAMSYSQAREQALFLTDKMAYELNLTDDQYEAAYEINLDYLLSVNSDDELYEQSVGVGERCAWTLARDDVAVGGARLGGVCGTLKLCLEARVARSALAAEQT
jgi:hypothetical protein